MKILKVISNYTKIMFVGVILGQYMQPIPLVYDNKNSALPVINYAQLDDDFEDDFGYSEKDRKAMDKFVVSNK